MKLKKTLFSTEIEVTPEELMDFDYKVHPRIVGGLYKWLEKYFDFKLLKKK